MAAGRLFMFGNYAGDVMNFEMAAELAALDNIEARIVLTTDDIASAPTPDQREKRRGVAGNFFVFKVVGAAADRMSSLDECEAPRPERQMTHTFTVGVALGPCSLPQTLTPNFEIGDDEMEIGMGIHGEPGVSRESLRRPMRSPTISSDRIFAEMPAGRGDKVAVLVNSLGIDAADGTLSAQPAGQAAPRRAGYRGSCHLGRQLLHVARNGGGVDHR